MIFGLFLLVFIGFPIGVGLLFYFIPKKLGYPKTGKYLAIGYGLVVLTFTLAIVFEDELFTKNDAKELVEAQNLTLQDDFALLQNESFSAIGDYYHTFTLKISNNDWQNSVSAIKNSPGFKRPGDYVQPLLYQQGIDRYLGEKVIQNYETENAYVREYFEPSGRQGYAPTFRRISISKTGSELIFEDIDE